MTDAAPTPAPPPRRGKLKIIILIVVVVLLLGGGAGGFFWWRSTHRAPEAAAAAPAAPLGSAIVPLEPFMVNLADTEASRFLRIAVRLVVDEESDAAEIEKDPLRLARVRSAILEVLTTQRSSVLVTPEGKTALKHALTERSTAVLNLEVRDVLFTDFVVQF